MNEINRNKSFSSEEFGALVLTEKLRRAVRKHPEDEILRAALHDAGNLLLLPENERAAHRDRLLIILEASRSHNP